MERTANAPAVQSVAEAPTSRRHWPIQNWLRLLIGLCVAVACLYVTLDSLAKYQLLVSTNALPGELLDLALLQMEGHAAIELLAIIGVAFGAAIATRWE